MSDIFIRNEINKLLKDSGIEKSPKILCSITRVFKMRHPNSDTFKVYKIAKELLR
ncbi:MAG: hypothetical protein AB7D38_02735 [Sulfurimonas sp.]|uniref:hypothetical protein n=1 Tax=Sulfurimonas sp. TaxID=2022749 RepID=UPI00269F415A